MNLSYMKLSPELAAVDAEQSDEARCRVYESVDSWCFGSYLEFNRFGL